MGVTAGTEGFEPSLTGFGDPQTRPAPIPMSLTKRPVRKGVPRYAAWVLRSRRVVFDSEGLPGNQARVGCSTGHARTPTWALPMSVA